DVARPRVRAVRAEQHADLALGLRVVALAEVRAAHVALAVDEVLRRPELVVPRLPGLQVVVLDDGIAQPGGPDRALDVARVLLEGELRRVDADDRQPGAAIARVPRLEVGLRADA